MKNKRRTTKTAPAIAIGASRETVLAARDAIVAILNTKADAAALVAACQALATICNVSHTTISHCHFQ
jgi:hypothetical protein